MSYPIAVPRGCVLALALCLLALSAASAQATEPAPQGNQQGNQMDYGITLAMTGNLARAESVFVSLLAPGRGDSRSFNNLGNLELLRGEVEVALAFYERAIRSDSADAGIRLNRSVALMLLGREEESRDEAAVGVRLAGGLPAASALLGLHPPDSTGMEVRGAQKTYISPEEVRAMLTAAVRSVPRDSVARAEAPATGGKPGRRPAHTWRSGGPRAAQESDAHTILYWKH
jgi:tetratricopeptide (TPR) repeat protein